LYLTGSLWLCGAWFVSHEMLHQLVRLLEFDFALRGGQFPVRWCDNLMAGYGYPFFNFYGPLSFAVAEVFHVLGLPLTTAWKSEITLSVWLGGVGMYGLLRGRAGRFGATAGALLYLFAPYHILTLYVRGNLPELTALCIWPWAFWGADAVARSGGRWRGPALPAGALALGALASVHVLTAYMAAFNLVAWGLFLALEPRLTRVDSVWSADESSTIPTTSNPANRTGADTGWKPTLHRLRLLAALGLFGAAVGAFFWAPAVHDIRYCSTTVLYERIAFQDHFVYPLQFFSTAWGYGLSVPGHEDGMSFQLGVALWIGIAGALGLVWFSAGRTRSQRIGAGAALALTTLHLMAMTPVSRPIWNLLPGAAYMQFPWRLLIPATFWASMAGGIAAGAWAKRMLSGSPSRRFRVLGDVPQALPAGFRILAVVLLALPAGFAAPYLHPLFFYMQVPDYDPAVLRQVLTDTADGEYLPLDVEEVPPAPSQRRVIWLSAQGEAQRVQEASGYYRFRVEAREQGLAAMDLFWFPGWRVRMDGKRVESLPMTRYGFVGWSVPAGNHELVVAFGETPVRRSADLISLTAVALAVAWLAIAAVRAFRSRPRP